jgi:hypothetical protein
VLAVRKSKKRSPAPVQNTDTKIRNSFKANNTARRGEEKCVRGEVRPMAAL